MKHTSIAGTSAAILFFASACSGVDETSFDTTEPHAAFDLAETGEDDLTFDTEGAHAQPGEPVTGVLEQALGVGL